jgi:hypothetical protein
MQFPLALAVLATLLTLLPAAAAAQDAGLRSDTRLQMERTHPRLLVRPDPPLARAREDVERALDDLDARRGLDARRVAEDAVRPPRAPQLDPDVTTAIQARNLQRARGR